MFDFITKHKKLVQIAFVLLIVPPFAFFGLESYTRSIRGGNDLATVGGVAITQQEFAEALRVQQDRLRGALGSGFDPAALDTPEMREALLDSLINQRANARCSSMAFIAHHERYTNSLSRVMAPRPKR